MFNTWKQNSNSYVVLPTGPPFERSQNGKPRRSACNPCRVRKIRCTSEPDGCRNCRSRNLQCEYGTEGDSEPNFGAIKGRRQMRHKGRSNSRSRAPITPCTNETAAEDDIRGPNTSNFNESTADDSDALQTDFHHMEPDWSEFIYESPNALSTVHPHTGVPSPDTQLDSTAGMLDMFNSPEAFLTSPPMDNIISGNLSPSDCFPFPQSMTSSTKFDLINGDASCKCPATPLETWEALTISISSKDSASEKYLQSQKAAISSCEALIRCTRCSSRSENIMLLIDICAKLLESFKSQDRALQTQGERAAVHEMTDNEDGDEGSHVRRNLWMSRMRRLGRLIAKVGDLLEGDQWSAQRRLIQDVQLRFTGVMFGWQQ